MRQTNDKPVYTLRQLVLYFLKLGYAGFGGPIALVGYMHRDLVETRQWISEEEYKEGLAFSQLAPGPLAAQLSIYLGFVHYRLIGATLAGLVFILPSFLMVVGIGVAYKIFEGLPWMVAMFYGVGASVIGIIAISSYRLTIKSIGPLNLASIRQHWLLWLFFVAAVSITITTEREEVLLFVLAGAVYMFVKAPPHFSLRTRGVLLLGASGLTAFDTTQLFQIGVFFAKAGAFVFGSGLAIVPFLHGGAVVEYKWLNEQQFLDAVAVAMITPGPVVITTGFIGYLIAGLPGAIVAATATFLPCYLITVIGASYFRKISGNASVKAFVDGITAAVVGALVGSVVILGRRSIYDWPTLLIGICTIIVILRFRKTKEPVIILFAAAIGLVIKQITP
jgi:chromate transporter